MLWKKSLTELWPNLYSHELGSAITANLWGINEGGGRFYAANRKWMPTQEKIARIGGIEGVKFVEAHDTCILDLGLKTKGPGSYGTKTESACMKALDTSVIRFEQVLKAYNLRAGMFTMNLFSADPRFIKGNFGSMDDETRLLAITRTKKGLAIAQQLQCPYVYWVGTEGPDGQLGAEHAVREKRIYDAIVQILGWHLAEHGEAAVPFCAENKCEEPKWHMYNGTAHAFTMIAWRLRAEHPDIAHLFRVNLEIGHEVMVKQNPAMSLGHAVGQGLLGHVHFNDQGNDGPAFDRDLAAGSQDPLGLIDDIWQLYAGGYTGKLGIDVQPLPTDTDVEAEESIRQSAANIRWAVDVVKSMDHKYVRACQAAHDQSALSAYLVKAATSTPNTYI